MLIQALMHLLLDLGELGATLGILWRCLHAYQPLALGWFRARIRPLRSWLCPALLACAFFPLVDLAAARSQVGHLHLPCPALPQRAACMSSPGMVLSHTDTDCIGLLDPGVMQQYWLMHPWLVQGWFPYDKELWGPNVLEQSLASGDMVRPSRPRSIQRPFADQTTQTCISKKGFLLLPLWQQQIALSDSSHCRADTC